VIKPIVAVVGEGGSTVVAIIASGVRHESGLNQEDFRVAGPNSATLFKPSKVNEPLPNQMLHVCGPPGIGVKKVQEISEKSLQLLTR
jgi:hypothetical protein